MSDASALLHSSSRAACAVHCVARVSAALVEDGVFLDSQHGFELACRAREQYSEGTARTAARTRRPSDVALIRSVGPPNIQDAATAWGAELRWVPGGHFPWVDDPDGFTETVASFVGRR